MAIRGNQWPSEAISGHQRSSVAISGHQWPSVAIRGHQRSSEAIRGHQRHLGRDDKRSRLRRRERRRRLGDSISIIQPDRRARAQPDFKKGSQRHRRHAVKVRNGRGRACNRLDGFPIGGLNPHAFVRMQRGRQVGGALLAASRQVGLQAHSVHLTGGQSGRPSEVIRGHQRSSEVLRGHQRSSERSSEGIRETIILAPWLWSRSRRRRRAWACAASEASIGLAPATRA
jgi:hypothetical protein